MQHKSVANYLDEYNSIIKDSVRQNQNLKVALLRSFSCELLEKVLTVEAYMQGYSLDFWIGGFNQYSQEILDTSSALYSFNPDIIILWVNLEDILTTKISDESVENFFISLFDLMSSLRKNSNSKIITNNYVKPFLAIESSADDQSEYGMSNLIRKLNLLIATLPSKFDGVYVVDFDKVISNIGTSNAYDIRMKFLAKNPYVFAVYVELSKQYVSLINSINGKRKKCIVLDLDNTLWKGIVGEDGFNGIQVNDAFKAFQKNLLYWKSTGVLLAINSKNNFADAMSVIENHPDMVLRKDCFSSFKINWKDKASNIKELAGELNIGLDSLIFIDDSEFECDFVSKSLPMVEVIHLDGNYIFYSEIVKNLSSLNFVKLTDEDVNRTDLYKAQAERNLLKERVPDLDTYLKELHIELKIEEITEFSLPRASQLTQKTNQFNLTTKRLSESELKLMKLNGYGIYTLQAVDKFGDNGITGLMIIEKSQDKWLIDVFLLSCRVMGRNIEHAFMAWIIQKARTKGINKIVGTYIATPKNKPVEYLYKDFGFKFVDGKWEFNTKNEFHMPEHIKVITDHL